MKGTGKKRNGKAPAYMRIPTICRLCGAPFFDLPAADPENDGRMLCMMCRMQERTQDAVEEDRRQTEGADA